MEYIIKSKTRKKINRSGTKCCQICKEQNILVEHHIGGRKIYGANKMWNLCNICDNCHRKIHEGKIIIEGWFTTTNGRELLWHYVNEESKSGKSFKTYLIPK